MLLRHQRGILIGFTLLIYSLQGYTNVQAVDQVISEQEGKTVVVPCPVNKEKCGELHSLNWFKGDNRIAAMLLDDSNVTSVAEEYEDRVSVEQNPFRLIIRNLQIGDEDIYLCDTTYFIPIETCDNFNGHRVELNVLVPPSEVVILDEKGDRIENGSIVGPMQERQMLKATCIVKNTRPTPEVTWWRGNKRLTTYSASHPPHNDGLINATLDLSMELSRDDLGQTFECRAVSGAIKGAIRNFFSVDLHVRPTSIHINGVEHHTVQGSKVVLSCDVYGARPAVNLTWTNTSVPISPEENGLTEIRTKAFEEENGTFHTKSELIFNATRFENDKEFRCDAENSVLAMNGEKPFQTLLVLEVLYPPVIKVSPLNATVNTGESVLLYCEYVANPASLTSVVWYRNGEVIDVNDSAHYKGGNSEHVALSIRKADKDDIGNYTCELSNEIGKGISEQQIDLDVLYVPTVEVLMIPEGPVKESDESNVTLFCNILDANPATLTKVRWYANSTLLKELPDCEETKEDLCHIDPSKLLLESIGRGFFYNYSCEGFNAAGWGPRSEDKELLVHYEPGPATLAHFPLVAVKKKSVTFSCSVDDPGYPESNRFRWLRGGRGPLQDIVTKDWTIEPVGLDSRTNYSCYAFNDGGKGVMATVNLEVHAPPFFIKNLPPYTGMLHTSRNANLTCRIECVPRCEISWLKDGVPIEKNDTRYFVKDKYMDASPATGDFESMLSVLHLNMSNWPNNKFDIEGDNANYTCISTGNTVGPGIKSATYFSIEYAPDNTTVSEEVVYVQEETIPGRVICKSRANPEPTYEWRFNNKTVIRGNALIINTPMMRNDTGRYTCVAYNKHGRSSAETFIDVQFKPRCEIERQEIDDQDTLICTAFGNPEEADFSWSIKAENESVEWLGSGDSKTFKDKSFYVLKEDYAIARTYRCVANNTAGAGAFCEIDVAEQLAWWQRWDKTTLIILVASILVLLLAVVIICCIIICICRRRRRQDKYRTDVSMSATHSVLSYQPNMPQLIPANTVLPDTLKVSSIMAGILMPPTTLSSNDPYTKEHQHSTMPIIPTTPKPTTPTQPQMTPKQTPTLTAKHTLRENVNNKSTTQIQAPTPTATATLQNTNAPLLASMTGHGTPTLSVRHGTQAPKSPPRWPLRPGVMVHVSSDTKENLAVNRMTLKPNATLANLTASTVNDSSVSASTLNNSASTTQTTLLNVTAGGGGGAGRQTATLGRIGRQGRIDAAKVEVASTTNSNTTTSNEPTYACQTATLPRCGTKSSSTSLIGEISSDLQTELRSMEEVTQAQQQADSETQRLTTQTETETAIRVEVSTAPTLAPNEQQQSQAPARAEAATEEPSKLCRKSPRERVEDFFANLFFKRSSKANTCRDSQRSHVGLLGGKFWKRATEHSSAGTSTAATASSSSPFATEHRLKGIRSSGSVTYKKCAKTTSVTSTTSTTTSTSTCHTSSSSATNNSNNSNNHNNNTNTNLTTTPSIITPAITTTITQQQIPQPQTQQQQHPVQVQHPQQQLPLPHPLPASAILTGPSTSTSHPATYADPSVALNSTVTTSGKAVPPNIPPYSSIRTNVTPSTALMAAAALNARGEAVTKTSNNTTTTTSSLNSSIRSIRKGILKAPTPPPRPPPPVRRVGAATTAATSVVVAPQQRLVQRSASLVCPTQKFERVQMQEKSSSMADPLTEPGEYENLPFHGLQTAPNKFTTPTTPTNFNNNTNVVRSVPRPKRLNGNISQTAAAAATYYDEHETDTQQQQQYYQQHQQQQYSTMPYNRHPGGTPAAATSTAASAGMQTMLPNGATARNEGGVIVHNNSLTANTLQHNQNSSGPGATSTNPHQMTYNLNNCFPKSYTEYYQNQQQQQQQQHHPFQQKFANSPSSSVAHHPTQQMLNAIEHDFSTYAVVERPHNTPTSSAAAGRATNPFLAVSNFKKFDTSGDEEVVGVGGVAGQYQTTSMKRQGKRKTFVDKLEDKRFYSLKFSGNNKQKPPSHAKNAALNLNASLIETPGGVGGAGRLNTEAFNGGGSARAAISGTGMFGSLLGSGNKCKRHHSFAGGSLGDIDTKGPVLRNGLHFYDPPAYENVNDAVQVHASAALSDMELPDPMLPSAGTATVLLHPLPYATHNGVGGAGGSQGPKKKHHQRQHQPKEDLNLIEPERLSIYRSDSGISNSSYECVTPIPNSGTNRGTPPPGKTPRTPKTPKTPKGHKNQTLAHSAVTASFNSSHKKQAPRVPPPPLYMNVNDQQQSAGIANLERPSSPSSNMATSAYESASSSQNDTTCNDPTSMSSGTSLYSNNKPMVPGARCNRHQQAPELTTPEEYEQYQLGHHSHAHSASSLSVASSVSASGNAVGVGRTKCKKQQRTLGGPNINLMELNKRPLANNPFLATNPAATTTATCSKKFRRQTISDPYAHIKHINECNQWRQLQQYLAANNGQAHNYCAKSTNAFQAAAPATSADKPSACVGVKSQQQQRQPQQIGLQQCNVGRAKTAHDNGHQQQHQDERPQQPSASKFASNNTRHQQQMLMFYDNIIGNNSNATTRNTTITTATRSGTDNDDGRPTRTAGSPVHNEMADNGLVKADDKNYLYPDNDGEDVQSFNIPHMSLNCDVADDDDEAKHNIGPLHQQHLLHQQQQHQPTDTNVRLSNRPILPMTIAATPNQSHCDDTLGDGGEGCVGRPVKLPLRKYHSFHFQPTQTVAGQHLSKLQQLRAQQQQQHQLTEEDLAAQASYAPYLNEGPLVFRPYQLNEAVTFKPIQPSEESEDSIDLTVETKSVGTSQPIKGREETLMDSGDFTNFSKFSTPSKSLFKDSFESSQGEPPELPKTLPPTKLSKNVSFYGDKENFSPISTKTCRSGNRDSEVNQKLEKSANGFSAFPVEKEDFNKTHEVFIKSSPQTLKKSPLSAKASLGHYDANRNPQDLQKSPNSAFVKPPLNRSLENLGVSFITAGNEKSPRALRSEKDLKTTFLKLDLNKNSPHLESPQHLRDLQQMNKLSKPLKGRENLSENLSYSQAKLEQLGKIYKLSSPETSEDDKDTSRTSTKAATASVNKSLTSRKLFFTEDSGELPKISTSLNPAASLEALEMLTKSQPQLWASSNQAGSRQNLHQLELFHTLQNSKPMAEKVARSEDDDEDLGYSFCEDDNVDDEEEEEDLAKQHSPNVTVIMAGGNNGQENRVKYILTQNHQEPLNTQNFDDEFIYADLESQHYGPINYKAASVYSQVKKNKDGALVEVKK